MRNRPLSTSVGKRRSVPTDSKRTGTLALRLRSAADLRKVGTRPRSSRTIGRTSKMNVFVASSACWTIATSSLSSCRGTRGVALEEALDDLCLKSDVGDALRRPVVHLACDLAAHLLLCRETVGRLGRRWSGDRPATAADLRRRTCGHGTHDGQRARDAIHEALQSALLATQDVKLRLHQHGSACLIEQLRARLGQLPQVASPEKPRADVKRCSA